MVRNPSNLPKLGIPAKVLKGEVPQFKSVSSIYKSVFAQQFMMKVHAAFWRKALSQTDDLGNVWKPLAPITHRTKPTSPIESNDFRVLKNWYEHLDEFPKQGSAPNLGLLPPAYRQTFDSTFRRELRRLIQESGVRNAPKGSRKLLIKEATRRAWAEVKKRPIHGAASRMKLREYVDRMSQEAGARGHTDIYSTARKHKDEELELDYEHSYSGRKARIYRAVRGVGGGYGSTSERQTPINIRTGALVAATRPGTISGNRYYPPPNQQIQMNPRSLSIDFPGIPYFDDVQAVRPVIPANAGAWIEQAHMVAIRRAKLEYDRIRNDNKNRLKSRAGKVARSSRVGRP